MSSSDLLLLRPGDSVAVARRSLRAGEELSLDGDETRPAGSSLRLLDDVQVAHKVCVVETPAGAPVLKYGQTIGFASRDIPRGAHVHDHNCRAGGFERVARDAAPAAEPPRAAPAPPASPLTFRGYARPDGRVGTRNHVAVLSSVNCSASVSRAIAERVGAEALAAHPSVDGVIPLTHKTGCGMAYDGPDHRQLERVFRGYATHPNIGGCLLVGLGCEIAQLSRLAGLGETAGAVPRLEIQEEGGILRTVEAGVRTVVERLLPLAGAARREEQPASRLVVALQCGGSDGWSGITANPALGVASDLVVAQGGTVVLGETPEIYGAEHLLAARASRPEVAERLLERIRWWEEHVALFGATIDNNPTPGNRAGGITTIYEKSLGAVAKAGTTPLRAVLRYAEPVTERGFVVMDTPGYDPVSLTGIVAGGANVIVFTTGRGSVYGCRPTPSIKVATNTPLFERLRDDMDIDAGGILAGETVESVGHTILERILRVASGEPTLSERHGVGEEEFAPWSLGPVL